MSSRTGLRSASSAVSAAGVLVLMAAACVGSSSAPVSVGEPAAAPAPSDSPAGRVVRVGHRPEGVAVDPATGLVAVATRSPNTIEVLDPDGRSLRSIALPSSARHLRFAARPGLVLAPLEGAGLVASIDVQAGTVVDQVRLQRQPHDVVAVSDRAFVSNEFSDTLAVVEAGRVLRELPAPAQPGGVTAVGTAVGVVGVRAHRLEVFDADSLRALGSAPAGAGPTHADGIGSRLYVVDTLGGAVLVFVVRPQPVQVATVPAPGRPYGVAVDPQRQRLWVTETATDRLAEYDVSNLAPHLVATYPTVRQPDSVAVDSRTGRVYVTGATDGELQILQV
jgi:DNA-binding beta-propeller fold protein YncE